MALLEKRYGKLVKSYVIIITPDYSTAKNIPCRLGDYFTICF